MDKISSQRPRLSEAKQVSSRPEIGWQILLHTLSQGSNHHLGATSKSLQCKHSRWEYSESIEEDACAVGDPLKLPDERILFQFSEAADLAKWTTFQDSDAGGESTITLQSNQEQQGSASISGNFSTKLREDQSQASSESTRALRRSGFVGISSKESEADFDGLDEYNAFIYRLHGDGRSYIANLRTDNWITGGQSHDVWQAALLTEKGKWQDVLVPFSQFLLTWRGRVVETRQEINPDRILSMGISLAGGTEDINPPGRFQLDLEWIKAKRIEGLWETGRRDFS